MRCARLAGRSPPLRPQPRLPWRLRAYIVALVVTPEGLPLAYEMLPGNAADKTTLRAMLSLVQKRHGQARRVWVMDRGIATEEVLAEMRSATTPVHYLVGMRKGCLTKLESRLTERR